MPTNRKVAATPGPWEISRSEYKGRLDISIRAVSNKQCAVYRVNTGNGLQEEMYEANARLIAAAPDLLKALYAFQKGFADGSIQWTTKRKCDSDPYHPANTLMWAAIAKAEGR